jgi:hypothetical protein
MDLGSREAKMVEFMGRRKRIELLRKCSRELWLQISV